MQSEGGGGPFRMRVAPVPAMDGSEPASAGVEGRSRGADLMVYHLPSQPPRPHMGGSEVPRHTQPPPRLMVARHGALVERAPSLLCCAVSFPLNSRFLYTTRLYQRATCIWLALRCGAVVAERRDEVGVLAHRHVELFGNVLEERSEEVDVLRKDRGVLYS